MSWSDILYPGNPVRRERVVRLHQDLIIYIELNFDTTNDLIKALNTHCQFKLQPIKMNRNGTVRENCDVLLAAMKSIQDTLQAIDARLKSELKPDLYQKLHDVQEPDAEKMQIFHNWATGVSGFTGLASGILIKLVSSKVTTSVMSKMMTLVVKVGSSIVGAIFVGALLGVGVDLIFSAILGGIERDQLETVIRELQPLVDELKAAYHEYNKTIMKISCTLP